jgi:hypothetical protein
MDATPSKCMQWKTESHSPNRVMTPSTPRACAHSAGFFSLALNDRLHGIQIPQSPRFSRSCTLQQPILKDTSAYTMTVDHVLTVEGRSCFSPPTSHSDESFLGPHLLISAPPPILKNASLDADGTAGYRASKEWTFVHLIRKLSEL